MITAELDLGYSLEPTDNELQSIEEESIIDDPTIEPASIYLHEIGRVPLLTGSEERSLAISYWRRKFIPLFQSVLQSPTLDDQRKQIARERARTISQKAKEAKQHLIEANLRLVVSIAKKYLGRGMSFLDLVQEGNLGLMRATEKFEWQKGYRFSTYATWWIRQAVTRSISDGARTIRLPVHAVEKVMKIEKAKKTLTQRFGRDPTSTEIASAIGMHQEKIEDILLHSQVTYSLDKPLEEDGYVTFGDKIADSNGWTEPFDQATKHLLKEAVADVLESLPPRERYVIEMRYGLRDGQAQTLEYRGGTLGLTRERIRQIEVKALKKLRHPSRSRKLRDYLD